MKRLMAAAAALSLMAGTSALADPPHDRGGSPPAGGAHAGGGGGGSHAGGGGAAHGAGAGAGGAHSGGTGSGAGAGGSHGTPPLFSGAGGGSGGPHAYVPQGRNDTPHPQGGASTPPARTVTHQGRPGFGAPGFAPGADRPRYDPQHFPRTVRAKQHFGWRGSSPWQDQPGYYYRRWAYGDVLPVGWFAADFWINDYDDYDLPVPPYGYEWVRSGPDALLVDTYTGEVVESVYGVF